VEKRDVPGEDAPSDASKDELHRSRRQIEYFVAAYALHGPVDGERTEAGSPALHERLAPRALRVLLSEGERRTITLRPVRM
jgi:hypothetical protein